MARNSVQLYTLRDLDESVAATLDRVGNTGYDGVEFAHKVRDAPTEDVVGALNRTDLDVAAAHVGLETLEEEYEATVEMYDRLCCETLVIPWLDPEHFETEQAVADAAGRVNDVADALESDGKSLAYHNHDQEFVSIGDTAAMDVFLDYTDTSVGFEIDLGWVTIGGSDPVDFVERYADRITHVHFADAVVASRASSELGEGDLDLDAAAAAVKRIDPLWHIYEHDQPADPLASLTHGLDVLKSL